MKISTMVLKIKSLGRKILSSGVWAFLVWLLLWQVGASLLKQEIFLPYPGQVIARIMILGQTFAFWQSIFYSLSRIMLGFLLAVFFGTGLGILSFRSVLFRQFLHPGIYLIKAMPVASFIILALVFIKIQNLAVFISFLMGFPILYQNVLKGLENTDQNILEMAVVFQVPIWKKARYIYLSSVLPFFETGTSLALGLVWKAGIAAEVIGIPPRSIGENLYNAKIYLNMVDLFAWTLVIILLSIFFEKLLSLGIKKIIALVERR